MVDDDEGEYAGPERKLEVKFSLHRPLREMRALVAAMLGSARASAAPFFLWNERVGDDFTLSNACYDSTDAVMVRSSRNNNQ